MLPRAPVAITALFVAIVAAMRVRSRAGAGWAAWRLGPAARRGVRLAGLPASLVSLAWLLHGVSPRQPRRLR